MTTVGGDQRHRFSTAEVSFTQDSEPIGQFDIQCYVNSLQSTGCCSRLIVMPDEILARMLASVGADDPHIFARMIDRAG